MADDKPIIIIKKGGGHGGHHGGAWKVAYADFVTAMMAFFMVMWLVNSSEVSTRQNIASYFRRPGLFQEGSGTPLLIGQSGILQDAYVPPHPSDVKQSKGKNLTQEAGYTGSDQIEADKRLTIPENAKQAGLVSESAAALGAGEDTKDDKLAKDKAAGEAQAAALAAKAAGEAAEITKKQAMEKLAADIKGQIAASPELTELLGIVDVKVEADGLSIEIMDTDKTSMFASGSARIMPEAQAAFQKIAGIIQKVPNKLDIIGHTDSKGFSSRPGGYSNWELSADRANAARRLLEGGGVPTSQILSVVGRADKELKDREHPLASGNRRITMKLRFETPPIKLGGPVTNSQAVDRLRDLPTAKPEAKTGAKPTDDPTPSFSAKDVLSGVKDRRAPTALPDTEPTGENPAPKKPELIFGDSPVIGPKDPFSGL